MAASEFFLCFRIIYLHLFREKEEIFMRLRCPSCNASKLLKVQHKTQKGETITFICCAKCPFEMEYVDE